MGIEKNARFASDRYASAKISGNTIVANSENVIIWHVHNLSRAKTEFFHIFSPLIFNDICICTWPILVSNPIFLHFRIKYSRLYFDNCLQFET